MHRTPDLNLKLDLSKARLSHNREEDLKNLKANYEGDSSSSDDSSPDVDENDNVDKYVDVVERKSILDKQYSTNDKFIKK